MNMVSAQSGIGFPALGVRTAAAGFTLVEVLIALVLSSIIFVSAYQVISNLIQYQVRARAQYDQKLDRLLLKNLFTQIIEKSLHGNDLFFNHSRKSAFVGRADSLQLVSRAYHKRFDIPGHRIYRIFEYDGELMVSYRRYQKDYLIEEESSISTGLKVEGIQFSYLAKSGWQNEWEDEKTIPSHIKVSAQFSDGDAIQITRPTGQR
jgi:type II secretion system protein J